MGSFASSGLWGTKSLRGGVVRECAKTSKQHELAPGILAMPPEAPRCLTQSCPSRTLDSRKWQASVSEML